MWRPARGSDPPDSSATAACEGQRPRGARRPRSTRSPLLPTGRPHRAAPRASCTGRSSRSRRRSSPIVLRSGRLWPGLHGPGLDAGSNPIQGFVERTFEERPVVGFGVVMRDPAPPGTGGRVGSGRDRTRSGRASARRSRGRRATMDPPCTRRRSGTCVRRSRRPQTSRWRSGRRSRPGPPHRAAIQESPSMRTVGRQRESSCRRWLGDGVHDLAVDDELERGHRQDALRHRLHRHRAGPRQANEIADPVPVNRQPDDRSGTHERATGTHRGGPGLEGESLVAEVRVGPVQPDRNLRRHLVGPADQRERGIRRSGSGTTRASGPGAGRSSRPRRHVPSRSTWQARRSAAGSAGSPPSPPCSWATSAQWLRVVSCHEPSSASIGPSVHHGITGRRRPQSTM